MRLIHHLVYAHHGAKKPFACAATYEHALSFKLKPDEQPVVSIFVVGRREINYGSEFNPVLKVKEFTCPVCDLANGKRQHRNGT
jgi:hypothetical protein